MSAPFGAAQLVAVLRRRGRFLTAEPLFGSSEPLPHGRPRSDRGAIVVGQARQAARTRGGAGEGDIVLISLPRRSPPRVLRRVGRPEVARDVIEALLLDRGLRRAFGAAVEREAGQAGGRVLAAGSADRRDLTELPTFTIDPIGARDFDDAISAERGPDGTLRIWVHIADVSAHVAEGSAVDREARRRATSVYAPATVEPMLPHALSSDACSLLPGVVRAAVSAELQIEGESVRRVSFHRSLIRSDERLDYERVDRIFSGHERAREPWAAPLELARSAAAALGERRRREGALALDAPEPEFELDSAGDVVAISHRVQTESHRLIENLMIAANEAVASVLAQRGVPCLYRVHERPDPARVERLVDQLASLEVPTPALPEHMSPSQAATLLGEISVLVQRQVRAHHGRGATALASLVLRSLKQAYYSPVNLGHAGLRSTAYCHFTSPIRRYPDLVCHRALLCTLGAAERAPRTSELPELGIWTSEREREAMLLERDADDVAACFALERRLRAHGRERVADGEVTGLIGAGAFVAFDVPSAGEDGQRPFEGMLPVRMLRGGSTQEGGPGRRDGAGSGRRDGGRRTAARGREPAATREWWELNEQGTILRGERTGATLRLGDELQVRVGRIDAVRGRVDLEPAG